MMTFLLAVQAWLNHVSVMGAPRWMWATLTMMVFAEWALGRSKNPHLRSIAAALAVVINRLVLTLRIASLPIAGPLLMAFLRVMMGDDPPAPAPAPAQDPAAKR